jgi:choice-of-anchor C domain-containing protein
VRHNLGDTAPITIGGVAPSEGNTIAGGASRGVELENQAGDSTRRVSIRGNRISGNAELGIDHFPVGTSSNDGVYDDAAPNRGIDRPVLTQAVLGSQTLGVVGYVGSTTLQSLFGGTLVDLYVSASGQGQIYLGTVTANADGEFAGTVNTAGISGLVAGSTQIVATATDAQGNTSEFSAPVATSPLAALQNAGFETGSAPGAMFISLGGGNTGALPGWVVTGHSIDYVGGLWTASEGSRSLDLSGGHRGGIAQIVQTVPGQSYVLSFSAATNMACGSPLKNLRVTAGTTVTQFVMATEGAPPQPAMLWADRTIGFTATSESTVLCGSRAWKPVAADPRLTTSA